MNLKLSSSLALCAIGLVLPGHAAPVFFNAPTTADNTVTRTNWLAGVGISAPQYFVDFESGFTNGQNISGQLGLFPAGLVIRDTSGANQAVIRSGSGVIGGSNPVGTFAVTQNELPFLELDFSASPIDYFGGLDIDQAGTSVIVTFLGGATTTFSLETTDGSGDTAEFFGIFRNDLPPITKIQFDASGDGSWGLDNLQYGQKGVPDMGGTLSLLAFGLAALVLQSRGFFRSRLGSIRIGVLERG